MARLTKSMRNSRRSHFERIAVAALAAAAVTTVYAPQARAGVIPLGDAANYAVLYDGTGGQNLTITNATIDGNVGVGGTGVAWFLGPDTITGELNFAATATIRYHNTNGSNVGPTAVNYGAGPVNTDLGNLASLSSSLAGLGSNLALTGTQTVNESSGQLDTVNGVTYRIFNVTSYSEINGTLLTIKGDGSGDPVVFNFAFNANVVLKGDVALAGGLTSADQVLWNFTTSGDSIRLNNNAAGYPLPDAFIGDILAPNDALSLMNANLDGRVFGGDGTVMQIESGDTINAPLDSPPALVPEPGSLSLLGTALLALTGLSLARRRRKTIG